MTRQETIENCYLTNSPKVVAEMLYDTITRYEKQIKEQEVKQKELDFLKKRLEKAREEREERKCWSCGMMV